MAAEVNQDVCVGCGVCESTCPVGAIKVDGKAKVDADACVSCGACAGECPAGAIEVK
jgi:ferredoxin